jgi:hypothetical protein
MAHAIQRKTVFAGMAPSSMITKVTEVVFRDFT